MEDFDAVLKEVKAELTKRGMQNSSLVFNKLAERYKPSFKVASKTEQAEILRVLRDYQSRSGFKISFDWESLLS
ncbi:TPA: hypothetical protein MCN56_004032 [Klebsiella pneumoniae]|nr:hypothetical protein [Klebsiella pneumoniae]HBT9739935.1 hypothetical protein [Klebsiella pneumoniae]HBU2337637.1 hypothetical protein [Klebsiella pneumoniae]